MVNSHKNKWRVFISGIMQQDNSEQVIIDPHLIAKHYIRTWFFLDLISSIPLDYVFLVVNSLTGTGVRVFRKYIKIWIDITYVRKYYDTKFPNFFFRMIRWKYCHRNTFC